MATNALHSESKSFKATTHGSWVSCVINSQCLGNKYVLMNSSYSVASFDEENNFILIGEAVYLIKFSSGYNSIIGKEKKTKHKNFGSLG